jgi:hypothetical protein
VSPFRRLWLGLAEAAWGWLPPIAAVSGDFRFLPADFGLLAGGSSSSSTPDTCEDFEFTGSQRGSPFAQHIIDARVHGILYEWAVNCQVTGVERSNILTQSRRERHQLTEICGFNDSNRLTLESQLISSQ